MKEAGPGIRQFGLHEEGFGALWWIEVGLPGHPLHFLQLASLGSCLDVLVVHLYPAPSSSHAVTRLVSTHINQIHHPGFEYRAILPRLPMTSPCTA